MGKIVRNTHISGEAGVIKFADYCNRHNAYIFFREVLKIRKNQVSLCVKNTLANEDIQQRDAEKSLLLSFSKEISTARDKKGLSSITGLHSKVFSK